MKQSQFKSYDDLPLFLNAGQVAQVLAVLQDHRESGGPLAKDGKKVCG